MSELENLIGEIIAEATQRHQSKAIEYWNCLRLIIDSEYEGYAIDKARRLVNAN